MRKILALTALLVLLATPLVADQHTEQTDAVDTVLLASTENYPDAMVASSAAAKISAPILLTEADEIPQDVSDTLDNMNPSKVLLIGGDAVISDDVKQDLEQDYNVSRLWGVTRYGTAVEVADYFWQEGAESALLVENEAEDDERVLGLAQSIARFNGEPVFLAPDEKIPAQVLTTLEELGVGEVGFIGGQLSEEAVNQLNDLGINVRERVGTGDNLGDQVRQQLRDSINASRDFVVIGAGDFRHSLVGTTDPQSNSYIVRDDEDTANVVQFINNQSIERVKVVGAPDRVEDIAEAIREGTDADVTVHGSEASQVSRTTANITGQQIASIAKNQRQARQQWNNAIEQNVQHMEQKANSTLQRAKDLARDINVSDDLWEDIGEIETTVQAGEYQEAYEEAREIVSELREQEWDSIKEESDRVRERARGEIADLQDNIDDLRDVNQEFADEMQQNLTTEERLEIIDQFRDKRREAIRDLVEGARDQQGELTERFREAERRVEGDIRTSFEQECAEDAPSIDELTASFKGEDGYVEAEGMLGLSTPNYHAVGRANVDKDNKVVSLRLEYRDVTRGGDVAGVQCTGVSEYEVRKYVEPGNWTVDVTAIVNDQTVDSATATVTVTGDDEENDDDEGNETEEPEETQEQNESETEDENVVTYSNNGFSPQRITIERGETVTWESQGPSMWVASNQHPTHTEYAGTSTSQHCSDDTTEDTRFDSCEAEDEYSFTFNKTGEWGYHNHLLSSHGGTVVVEE